ncbi:Tyrosine-protein phosphatase non-receptor type 14 [Taenia solium]|eukprot:TsM_001108100 transcript=TsM_001108100 gene=TsM_001108100
MPLKLNFKRTHRYNVSAKDLFVIPIYTLDASCVEYTVSPTTTGRDALEYVAQRLDIEDTCFFGFRYEAWTDDQRWLFLNKPVKKQLDKYARQHALVLNIMLFIDNPQYLPDSNLRRQFYLQLRQDVLTKQLKIASKQAIKLMAYSLQAEYGDFVDFETTAHMWRERPMVPASVMGGSVELGSLEHIDDIIWGYCQLRGVSQDNAIWYYLDEIRRLSNYGVQLFFGSTVAGEAAQLGVSRNGLAISTLCPINSSVSKHKWEDIKDLAYSRKTFTIQLLKKTKPIHFVFEDTQDARYLWNFCIQMHNSYIHYWTHVKTGPTAHVSEPPPLVTSEAPHRVPFQAKLLLKTSNLGGSETSGVVVNNSNSATTVGSVASMHATIGQIGENSFTSLQQSHANHLTSSSLPVSGSAEADHDASKPHEPVALSVALSCNAQQEDSEGGTLVDTLDSQMLTNRCVTCLPVTGCLRRGAMPKSSELCSSTGQIQPLQMQSTGPTPPRKKHHHHHRKHRLQPIPLSVGQGTTSAQEVAARYNMSLAESSSGSSSESEFESDVCSTSAETSSSSNSSRRGDDDVDAQDQQHGFRRLLTGSHAAVGAAVSLRPILSSFNQHHYRLQQNWREDAVGPGDNRRISPARQFGTNVGSGEGKSITNESHGWLASAKRLTSALSESLTRRALSSNPSTVSKPSPLPTPELLSRGPKSVGIAQVIRPEPPSANSNSASAESGGGFDENRRRPSRPPLPPSGSGGTPARHTAMGFNPNAPQRGASAGPATSGPTPSNVPGSSPSYPLHHSLYEGPAEGRLQICLQPPSPPSSQEEASWRLVQHPGIWINQLNNPNNLAEPRQKTQQQQQVYFETEMMPPPTSSAQQAMTPSSMTSSSTSTSTSSAGVVAAAAAAAATAHSNSSSPSSPASSIVEDDMMLIMMRGDKEDDSSSTMSYSACGGSRSMGKTAAVVTPIQKQAPTQQHRQRSLSGSGGPLHLLTNSDIHQLLNLTKMRETALVHRLLAEYRQTLLLQQSLHTNSMSTPNLAASQELHTTAATAAAGSNGFSNGNYTPAVATATDTAPQSFEDGCCLQRANAQRRTESHGLSGSSHDNYCGYRGSKGSRCGHHNLRSHQISESSDYVNACAFRCHHGCLCSVNHMQTSVHSTTDNDSNATFRVLSETDGGRNHYSNSRHHHHSRNHQHHEQQSYHRHHHEDSCTNNSDLLASSNCSQQGWTTVAKSNSFHHQPKRFGGGSQHTHEMCKSATPDNFHRQNRCSNLVKDDLSDTIVGSPQQTLGGTFGSAERCIGSDFSNNSANLPQQSAGFARSRTFAHTSPSHTTTRVAFVHAFDKGGAGGGSGHLHAGEYENLEADSSLLCSVNRKSTTDISVKSSSSDISFEDYKFNQRLQRRNRTPKLANTQCGGRHDHHQHCPHQSHRNCHFGRPLVASSSTSKRSTLPSISCDGSGGHIQLCWEHLRALEQLRAPKGVHIDTPVIQRRKQKKRMRKQKEPCCSYCSVPPAHRYMEKARSFDPYQQKSPLCHRCSASPVFSVEAMQSQCDLCRRQRRWRVDFGRPRCGCDDIRGSGDNDGASDEAEEEEEDDDEEEFSSSRAASDSSLASSALPGVRDTASIMVSSYEFECQQQQSHNATSSFDSTSGGATPRRCKNKPPTPKFGEERRGSSSWLQSHTNFYEDRCSASVKTGRATQIPTSRKTSVSPPTAERVPQRPERPKTLLSSSASFQVEDHHRHQPDTPSLRYANRPIGIASSRDGTPVRRAGGAGAYSRTPTPARSIGPQQTSAATPDRGGGGGGGGLLFTASMTFTPSGVSTVSPGPSNSSTMAGISGPEKGLTGRTSQHQQQQMQQQNDFQRCLTNKSFLSISQRDKGERSYLFPKKAQTPTEKRTTNATP